MKKVLNIFTKSVGLFFFGIITFNSLTNLYENRTKIKDLITIKIKGDGMDHDDHGPRYLVNPLKMSPRQIPPDNIENLQISDNAHKKGQWSAPIDWNVTAIHSTLLPDESVMTFGTFGIMKKEKKDIRANKQLTLSDGTELERDGGAHQWHMHDVNSGVDFDIWRINDGFGENAHTFYNQPLVMDAFCSVVRVLDENNVLIVGGNKNKKTSFPDTQKATMIYNIKNGTFERGPDLNYKRWYGSVIRTEDEKLVVVGGVDILSVEPSITPEILDLKSISDGWRILDKASSKSLFGTEIYDEYFYPRSFLSSEGNIVGISYNKIWVMDKNNDYRAIQTSEIPLATGGISRLLEHENPNNRDHEGHNHHEKVEQLRIISMGAPVGSSTSAVMIGKDQVFLFGGKQHEDEYTSSNQVYKIDFSNNFKPSVNQLKPMSFPRSNADATILPNGEIFINGGEAYNDHEFSIFTPEIYNTKTEVSRHLNQGYFRRNYHSTSLLLPNGTILVSGGDVWNSEIFYPPYLFTKDWNDKTILAKRPKIINLNKSINRGSITLELDPNSSENVEMFSIVSTGSVTHAQGSEQKFRSLEFSKKSSNSYKVDIPLNKNELANGTYMIFAISSSGVPSVGKIVYLN